MSRLAIMALCLAAAANAAARPDLERLSYGNEGEAWLGVGLWAWPMPYDHDGDGDLDLVVSTQCVPYGGTYFFENPGNGDDMPVFRKARKIDSGHGNIALSVSGGRPVVLRPNAAAWDPAKAFTKTSPLKGLRPNIHEMGVRGNVWRFADYDGDGRDDVFVGVEDYKLYGWANAYDDAGSWTNGPLRGFVYVCRNLRGSGPDAEYGQPERLKTTDGKDLFTYGNPMPMPLDWDGDGDLDIICGCFIDYFTYFENVGTRTEPRYAPGRKLPAEDGTVLRMELEMITPTAVDWNRDGRMDIICGDEDGRVAFLPNTGRLRDGMPLFGKPRYFRQEMDDLKFGSLATPFAVDWDGDGDIDLVTGNAAGHVAFIENLSGPRVLKPRWAEPRLISFKGRDFAMPDTKDGVITARPIRFMAGYNGSIQGPCETKWGYTALSVADWDGDGFLDIMCNSIFGDIVWFRNPGVRGAMEMEPPRFVEVEWDGAQPALGWGWRKPRGKALLTQWRTTPLACDWTGDGKTDLVMLDHEGYLVLFERTEADGRMALKPPRRAFLWKDGKPMRLNSNGAGGSGRRKLCVVDWDGDGRLDIVANGRNAELYRQVSDADGKWRFENCGAMADYRLAGHSSNPTAGDFDGDGVPELVIGGEDGYFYMLRNERARNP